jgi:hypothetical protein
VKFGIAETKYGYCVCVLQEDGRPLMLVSKPFACLRDAEQTHRVIEALQRVSRVEPERLHDIFISAANSRPT